MLEGARPEAFSDEYKEVVNGPKTKVIDGKTYQSFSTKDYGINALKALVKPK